ncbi:MAG: AAA family ATPase [Gemmatimonadota bacterium]
MTSHPIRLRTFGGLSIAGTTEAAATALANGPKRMALLAYLASVPAGAYVRRDSLLPLFWPELDQKRARHALRNTLYEIRKRLGSEIVRSRGKEEVGLATDGVEVDAVLFDRAIAEGRLEEAVALYRGPFLDGFHVPDAAPELEHWIDAERDRRERSYRAALERIAEARDAAGEHVEAASLWRDLVRREPIRERLVVRLVGSLVHAGERGRAIRAAQAYIDHMRDVFGADPAPRIASLVEQLRSDTAAEAASPAAAPAVRHSRHVAEPELLGRESEWAEILTAWRAADEGRAGFVVIGGVAGIGKTRLAEEMVRWAEKRGASVATGRCYDSGGRLAYGPISECLRAPRIRAAVDRLEPVWRTEIARILPSLLAEDAALAPPTTLVESWQRLSFFSALQNGFQAAEAPVLLLIDDMQWADSGTLDWLRFLMHESRRMRLLVMGTVRVEEPHEDHSWHDLRLALLEKGQLTEISLGPLPPDVSTSLAAKVAGRDLSPAEAGYLFAETEGNPLFVVEAVRGGVLESRGASGFSPAERSDRNEAADSSSLTPRVKAVIQRRFAALSPAGRELVSLASVIGQPFSPALASAACGGQLGETALGAGLDELRKRFILEDRPGARLAFTHDKLREVAYAEIGAGSRRVLHDRVAEALVRRAGTEIDEMSARLGEHLERAGRPDEAIVAYEEAADRARSAHAHGEVVRLLERALSALGRIPASEARAERERRLQLALGVAGVALDGWSNERSHLAFQRHMKLSGGRLTSDTVTAMWGLVAYFGVRGEIRRSAEASRSFTERAERAGHAQAIRVSRFNRAFTAFHRGEMSEAIELLESVTAEPEFYAHRLTGVSFPLGVLTLCYLGHAHWHAGRSAEADRYLGEATDVASDARGGTPFERAVSLVYEAMVAVYGEDPTRTITAADTAIELCDRHGIRYYSAVARVLRGWAVGVSGAPREGLAQMDRGLEAMRATGSDLRRPWYLGLMARLEGRTGAVEAGRQLVSKALALGRSRDELWSEPELLRIDGELLARRGAFGDAERALTASADLARSQGSLAIASKAEVAVRALEARHRAG